MFHGKLLFRREIKRVSETRHPVPALFESMEDRRLLSAVALAAAPTAANLQPSQSQAQTAAATSVVGVPALNSRPGAAYTVYVDFAGFNFTGQWATSGKTPGVTPAYDDDGNPAQFNAHEIANLQRIWSRISENYSAFDINITTVDPAVAAGKASDDFTRQNFYDATPRLMHLVIGGTGDWQPDSGGVSFTDVMPRAEAGSNGYHTDWLFSGDAPDDFGFVCDGATHEIGHTLGLRHQGDWSGNTLVHELNYGNASYAPIMGVAYSSARSLWSVGDANFNTGSATLQNDLGIIASDSGMNGFIEDHVGHTLSTATPLPVNGSAVNWMTARGTIGPLSRYNPQPVGAENYTADFWSFKTGGGLVTLNVKSGRSTMTGGTPDDGAALNVVLNIYNGSGSLIATVDTASLDETFSKQLAAGTYFARVTPKANLTDSSYNGRSFFDMGDYFITGSVPASPPAVVNNDPDDQIAEAKSVALGSTTSEKIGDGLTAGTPLGQDVDLYKFTAAAGQKISIDIDRASGSSLDSYIRLFSYNAAASSVAELKASDNTAAPGETLGKDAYLEYTFSAAGTYYLGVSGIGNKSYSAITGAGDVTGTTGAYSITFKSLGGGAVADSDDQLSEALPISTSSTNAGKSLSNATDVDMYKFTVSAKQTVHFDIDRPSGSSLNSYLRLFNASGAQLASNNNAAAKGETANSLDAYLSYTFATAGTYYIAVSSSANTAYGPVSGSNDVAGSIGNYTLILSKV